MRTLGAMVMAVSILPLSLAADGTATGTFTVNGKASVSALIDATDKTVLSTSLYDAAFKMGSVSVSGTNIKLDVKTLDKTTIAGRLHTEKPDDFNDVPFSYDITFTALLR